MAARELKANVYVDGVLYGPAGEKPSAEVAKAITNEKAWKSSEADSKKSSASGDDK